mgnify:CR=1 FL=1
MRRAILLIEDNPDHILLIQAALESLPRARPLMVMNDGAQALEYIRWLSAAPLPELPCLILLDLKLPKVDGLDILRALRASPAWRQVPVIVLTTSNHPADIRTSLAQGANAYLSKMSALNGAMTELIRAVETSLPDIPRPGGLAAEARYTHDESRRPQ